MGCHSLLQGAFLTQESNPSLPYCRQPLYRGSHQGSHTERERKAKERHSKHAKHRFEVAVNGQRTLPKGAAAARQNASVLYFTPLGPGSNWGYRSTHSRRSGNQHHQSLISSLLLSCLDLSMIALDSCSGLLTGLQSLVSALPLPNLTCVTMISLNDLYNCKAPLFKILDGLGHITE